MNLKKLISKASLGDKRSLDFIAEKYKSYVYFFCTTVISDTQKAEKAVEKAFKEIFTGIAKNAKTDNFDEFVTYETARVCKAVISDDRSLDNLSGGLQPFAEKDKISSVSAITDEQKKLLINSLRAINANQRIAVTLNLLSDYDSKKIADVLKIS